MTRQTVDPLELSLRAFGAWERDWFLLSVGDFNAGDFNCMTVSWGSLGVMWGKPMAMIVVRPSRFTFEFCEKYQDFTLSAFGPEHHETLLRLGTHSGRDMDKTNGSGLSPMAARQVRSPAYEEALLVLECHKMYWQDIQPEHFLHDDIEPNYGGNDYHRMYLGQVVAAEVSPDYPAGSP